MLFLHQNKFVVLIEIQQSSEVPRRCRFIRFKVNGKFVAELFLKNLRIKEYPKDNDIYFGNL